MPDEPTRVDLLEFLDELKNQWDWTPDENKIIDATRRRIERKVSREWVEQYLNAIKYCGRDGLMAGLKELGYEVDNA